MKPEVFLSTCNWISGTKVINQQQVIIMAQCIRGLQVNSCLLYFKRIVNR